MVFYGWGFTTKKTYFERKGKCDFCHKGETTVTYLRIITWFTLFFIPLIPYSKKFVVHCANCGHMKKFANKNEMLAEIDRKRTEQEEEKIENEEAKKVLRKITLINEKSLSKKTVLAVWIDGDVVAKLGHDSSVDITIDSNPHVLFVSANTQDQYVLSNIIELANLELEENKDLTCYVNSKLKASGYQLIITDTSQKKVKKD